MTTSPSRAAVAVDGVALLVVTGVAAWPLGDVFGGRDWVVAAALGLALGLIVATVAWRRGWGPLTTFLATAVGYVLVAPAATASDQAFLSFVPTLSSERTALVGLVESWRAVLTLPTPLGSTHGELVVPFVVTLLAGLAACTVLWRSRVPGLAWLPLVAVFAVAASFGDRDASLPVARGLLLTALLLVWLRWRTLRVSRASWTRRLLLGGLVLAFAGSLSSAATSTVRPDTREVLRDHVEPPLAELAFKSPLARYRDYYKNQRTDVLFTLDDLPAGKPLIRLASMDSFDGLVWNVTTTDLTTGSSAFRPAPYLGGRPAVTVTVGEYVGPWVPTVGVAVGAALRSEGASGGSRELLLNTATGGVAMHGDVRSGDVYEIEWEPRPEESADLVRVPADRSLPLTPMDFPAIEKLDKLAQRWIARSGADNDYERVAAIEQRFRDEGYFNDGLTPVERGYSASGHSARRLADLVADEKRMVGNDEQYAAAMAYAVQRMGIPARVVLGFERVAGDGSVTGDDIGAWVEVPFEDRGWMVFDPTPDESRVPPPLQDNPNPEPQPYVVQPPVLPQEPADLEGLVPAGAGRDRSEDDGGALGRIVVWVWRVGQVALVLSPIWLVVLAKSLRRRRRRWAADPVDRMSGAWREITDRARDLGTRVSPAHTRHETGVLLERRFPACDQTLLAAAADKHVFGPGVPTDAEVEAYWADVERALRKMRKAAPWWRRPWAWLSPASLPWHSAAEGLRRAARSAGDRLASVAGVLGKRGRVVRQRRAA